jgi:hypothetical protein
LQRCLAQLGGEGGTVVLAQRLAKGIGVDVVLQVIAVALAQVEVAHAADEGVGVTGHAGVVLAESLEA